MRIPKMYLKQSFSYSKWVLPAILSSTVFLNCVSVSSNFDTTFLLDCTKFCNVFSGYWIGNLMRIPEMWLEHFFSYSKWVLPAILFLTVFSNCVSVSSNFDTTFLFDCTKFCNVLSGYWIGNLMRILKMGLEHSFSYSKWVLPAILSSTVFSNCVSVSSNFDTTFLLDCTKFYNVFSGYWIGNLMRIPEMWLEHSFSYSK